MSKLSREKGALAERDAAHQWRENGFPEAQRRCSGEESQSDQGRDLKGTGGFVVQVKNDQGATPFTALAEAASCAGIGEIPVAWFRKNGKPFLAVLRPEDFFQLVRLAGLSCPKDGRS